MAQDYKSSIALLDKAVAIDPEFAMAYRSMAMAYSNLGFHARADQYRKKALDFADRISDRERWLIEGNSYSSREETYGKAIEAYGKVVALYPDDPVANNGLGNVYFSIEELEKSAERYEICVNYPGAPLLYYNNLSKGYARQGKYDRAREVVEGYLEKAGDSARAHLLLADCYLYEGRYDQALDEADKAFALDPSDLNVYESAGDAVMLKGDFARAEAEFRKLAEAAVKSGMPWRRNALTRLYVAMGKYGKALEQLALATDEARRVGEPSWLGPFNFFATLVYNGAGRYSESLKAAEQSYRIAETSGNMSLMRYALGSKGTALLGLKSLQAAQTAADELKALIDKGMNKKSVRGYWNLQAQIDLANGNYNRAVENAKAAVDSLPPQSGSSNPDGHYWYALALAYEATGDLEKARRTYEGLQKLTSGRIYSGQLYALSFCRLGLIAEKLGDKAAARRNYEKFLEIWKDADPGLPEVEDAKRRLAGLQN
jgi:tetratricopeptide (TPR) repeat protein